MGKIVSKFDEETSFGRGGIIDIDSLTRNPPKPLAPPKTTVESITETIERIITMPSMQPILEQAGNLLGAYAEKLIHENAVKQNASGPGQVQQLPQPTPIFGHGAKEP